MNLTYNFPAVKGTQAKSDYFICMVPLKLLSKIFINNMYEVPPEYRAQRKLNETRIPEIKRYISDNRDSYVFSALSASIDGKFKFVANSQNEDLGVLEVDMSATFLINDGQHRNAAIQAAMEEDDTLGDETISIVFFADKGLTRSQQMFTDLNKHAINTSKSLNALYESKDPLAVLTKRIVDEIDFFRKYTDKEKDNLGKYSSSIFTLNNILNANKKIVRSHVIDNKISDFVKNYWQLICSNIKEWAEMDNGQLYKKDLRENYIISQGITLLSFGKLGAYLYDNKITDMASCLSNLKNIDWTRSNKCWKGRAINAKGRIMINDEAVTLTYIQIKRLLGLEITTDEKMREEKIEAGL